MNALEDRLRVALEAKAQTFSASPDAWQRIAARDQEPGRPDGAGRRFRQRGTRLRFAMPAVAAAAMVAVVLGATALVHGFSGTGGRTGTPRSSASGTATPAPGTHLPPEPPSGMLAPDPPISAIIGLKPARHAETWFWIGTPSPLYWFPMIAAGPQLCHATADTQDGDSTGYCWPLPRLSAARPAVVLSKDDNFPYYGSVFLSGAAEPGVTSVTAVLPDGQRSAGAVGTGRGFPVRAWTLAIAVPALPDGTKLVFAGPSGQVITTLSTAAPLGPGVLDLPRPAHGVITMFSFPSGSHKRINPGSSVTAYLVDGHAAFFTSFTSGSLRASGAFSPYAASAKPSVDGMVGAFGTTCTPDCRATDVEAYGYAHGNVAQVKVWLPGGGTVTTPTFAAWPGSGLRLWRVSLPASSWSTSVPLPRYLAAGYDAAGHVTGPAAQLGRPEF
jgi:hypothetical protein